MGWVRRLFTRRGQATTAAPFDAILQVSRPMAVIGDVHGRHDLLKRMLAKLEGFDGDIVLVGDLNDRGEQSRQVFEHVSALPDTVSLMGNHERMLLNFISDPAKEGRRWMRNGGLQTLASFGIGGLSETTGSDGLTKAAAALKAALGPDLLEWLHNRPLMLRNGNVAVVHAMTDPDLPIDAQEEDTLIWRRPGSFPHPRQDGIWTVHGHTVVDEPIVEQGRIAIDTGAFATGKLSAVLLRPGAEPEFIQA